MSSILGHDIDGNPLRAGGRVVPADDGESGWHKAIPGWPWTVREMDVDGSIEACEIDMDGDVFCFHGQYVRKLPPKTDHEPADEEFTEWLKGINVGVTA